MDLSPGAQVKEGVVRHPVPGDPQRLSYPEGMILRAMSQFFQNKLGE